jgi:uncharacterized protein YjiS (DUF1127 family)
MTSTTLHTVSRTAPSATTIGVLVRATDALLGWLQRDRDRRALQALDDRLLRDIGVSRGDVEAEAAKPFWRN